MKGILCCCCSASLSAPAKTETGPKSVNPSDKSVRLSNLSLSSRARVEKSRSDDISRSMAREEAEYKREKAKTKKVLLLGTSSAGKTTVLKQMKLKWRANGFGDERESYCRSIRENLVGSLKRIFHSFAVLNYDVPLEISEQVKWFVSVQNDTDIMQKHHDRLLEVIPSFLSNKTFQSAIDRSNEYNLFDSAKYFLENYKRIISDDYIPTNDDILRVRNTTFREEETRFKNIDGPRDIVVYDVGGRKGQRKKWVHFFDDVDVILYIVSLSCFDQTMEETPEKNQMVDSIETFKTVVDSQSLKNIPIMLFLNKIDLFREKIKKKSVKDYFGEFDGKEHDYDSCVEFFKRRFRRIVECERTNSGHHHQSTSLQKPHTISRKTSTGSRRKLEIFETHATDQEQMSKFITGVKDAVLQAAIDNMFQS